MDTVVEDTLAVMAGLEETAQRYLREFLEAGMDLALIYFTGSPTQNITVGPAEAALAEALSITHENAVKQGVRLTEKFFTEQKSLTRELADLYRQTYSQRTAASINETTYRTIRAMLLRRQSNGIPIEQAAAEVAALIPGLAETRALLIARTETHSALQFASQQAALRSGIMLKKRWNTVQDERTRDFHNGIFSHRAMDGQIVSIDGSFSVPRRGGGFEAILFPGDPNGSAGNIINCRCVQTYERAS